MTFSGLVVLVVALLPAASGLRLPATRLSYHRGGRPIAQASPDDDGDAAGTAGKGFGPPRQSTESENAAAVSLCVTNVAPPHTTGIRGRSPVREDDCSPVGRPWQCVTEGSLACSNFSHQVSRGQKALEEMRRQAGAPVVPESEPEMYIPTQKEKARSKGRGRLCRGWWRPLLSGRPLE